MTELELVQENKAYRIFKCQVCKEPTFVEDKKSGERKCMNKNCPSKYNLSRDVTKYFTRSEFEK